MMKPCLLICPTALTIDTKNDRLTARCVRPPDPYRRALLEHAARAAPDTPTSTSPIGWLPPNERARVGPSSYGAPHPRRKRVPGNRGRGSVNDAKMAY